MGGHIQGIYDQPGRVDGPVRIVCGEDVICGFHAGKEEGHHRNTGGNV